MFQSPLTAAMQSASDVLHCFLQACLKQNFEKALALVTEDFSCTVPGKRDAVQNRDGFSLLLKKIAMPDLCASAYEISDYTEKELPGGSVLSLCRISMRESQQTVCPELSDLRLTAGFVLSNGQYRISFFHASVIPDAAHTSVRIPLHFINEHAEFPNAELQTLFSSLSSDITPGGVLGICLEDGYPPCLISNGLLSYLGYSHETVVLAAKGSLLSVLHVSDRRMVARAISEAEHTHQDLQIRFRIRKQDESYVWVCYQARNLVFRDGRSIMIGAVLDVSETIRLQERLERESTLDPLTQVYNRREAQRLIEHDLAIFGSGALLILSFDPFESFLSACGRLVGDEILIRLSRLLKENIRSDDIVARLSENEFIIYLHSVWHREDVLLQARRLYRLIQDVFQEQPSKYNLSLSIGGILAPRGQAFTSLCETANRMLQQSRQAASAESKIQIY